MQDYCLMDHGDVITPSDHVRTAVEGPGEEDRHERGRFDLAELPPGFRFHPTDEEIIIHYLVKKVADRRFAATALGEADLNRCEPWDLPKKAKTGEKEWFFFCQRDRKYPTGMRTNRATESGYWKATGKDKEIYSRGCLVGMKKTLVFYKGRAPRGEKTSWVMHEYRLEGDFSNNSFSRAAKDEWNICKVFHKIITTTAKHARIESFADHLLETKPMQQHQLPPLEDYSFPQNPDSIRANRIALDQEQGLINQGMKPSSSISSSSHTMRHYDQKQMMILTPTNFHHDPRPNPMMFRGELAHPNPPPSLGQGYDQDRTFTSYPPAVFSFKNSDEDDQESKSCLRNDEEQLEGLSFSPDISDLDCLWAY